MKVFANFHRDFKEIVRGNLRENPIIFDENDRDLLLKYCALVKRIPEVKKWKVEVPKDFFIPEEFKEPVEEIQTLLILGKTINPYLSRKIREIDYNDMLLND